MSVAGCGEQLETKSSKLRVQLSKLYRETFRLDSNSNAARIKTNFHDLGA